MGRYLLEAVAKDAVQDEVSPEERPLALDVFKELQLGRLVVEPVWILGGQISHVRAHIQHQPCSRAAVFTSLGVLCPSRRNLQQPYRPWTDREQTPAGANLHQHSAAAPPPQEAHGGKGILPALLCTCSLEMISSLVILTMVMSSTAKAGYEMTASSPASTSLDMEALGSMEVRMD